MLNTSYRDGFESANMRKITTDSRLPVLSAFSATAGQYLEFVSKYNCISDYGYIKWNFQDNSQIFLYRKRQDMKVGWGTAPTPLKFHSDLPILLRMNLGHFQFQSPSRCITAGTM